MSSIVEYCINLIKAFEEKKMHPLNASISCYLCSDSQEILKCKKWGSKTLTWGSNDLIHRSSPLHLHHAKESDDSSYNWIGKADSYLQLIANCLEALTDFKSQSFCGISWGQNKLMGISESHKQQNLLHESLSICDKLKYSTVWEEVPRISFHRHIIQIRIQTRFIHHFWLITWFLETHLLNGLS